jgi:predicted N-acyltransferase
MGERMGDRVLLVVAEDKGELVAGALNLIGGDTLYGRNWGCKEYAHYHALHFEACYYQVFLHLSTFNLAAFL